MRLRVVLPDCIDLEPGGSASINVIFGTASSRDELGYALPPGEYWLKVQVPLRRGRGEPAHALTAPLARITIVPRKEGQPKA